MNTTVVNTSTKQASLEYYTHELKLIDEIIDSIPQGLHKELIIELIRVRLEPYNG